MPKSETSNPNDGPSFQAPRYRPNWIAALICFLLGTMLLAAMADYKPAQSRFFKIGGTNAWSAGKWAITTTSAPTPNMMGPAGAETSRALLLTAGASAWLIPVFIFYVLWTSIRNPRYLTTPRVLWMMVCLFALSGLVSMLETPPTDYFPVGPGGTLGNFTYNRALNPIVGKFGSALLLGTIYACGLLFVFTKDIGGEVEKMLTNYKAWKAERAKRAADLAEQRRKDKEAKTKAKTAAATVASGTSGMTTPAIPLGPQGKKTFVPKGDDPLAKTSGKPAEPAAAAAAKPVVTAPPPPKAEAKPTAAPKTEPSPPAKSAPLSATKIDVNIVKPEETKKAKVTLPQSDDVDYKFPPLSLLKEQIRPAADSDEEYKKNMADLVRILGEFDVEVTPGEIHVGPVITRYEVVPAAGVRVEKISGLDKNIALGMRAQSVRILAPIPGKAAVGVEVPNLHATPVGLREIIESEDWSGARAELPIALGKDVSGKPLVSDLAKMPHLLIAGATGSGKSVCINSIVASILYSKSPKDVRLIMVDPKVVELKIFNDLPHMLIPVVTEPKKVPAALKILLSRMEERYQMFAKVNVRNITGFNSRKKNPAAVTAPDAQPALLPDDDIEVPERLPYIIAIIDELADLMMVAPAEIETSIARLAQLARAAGIHLIIATQRPSVNVITGVIKANLPSRIAFQVASQVDSRTILDGKGADTLIGRGDMLFTPPGTSKLVRAQGAFVADEEVQSIVDFLKKNGPPKYDQSVQAEIDRAAKEDDDEAEGGDDAEMGDDAELYAQAIDVLKSTRRASTSMLQRRLRIGYNRAARMMEMMEEKGIVGPENGSSPREILVDLDTL